MKQRVFDLIQTQTETIMLANATPEYVFTVIDPPIPPEVRVSPKRSLIVAFSVFLGALLGTVLALVRWYMAESSINKH